MTTRSLDLDGETSDLAGSSVSPQARRAGQASNVIPFRPRAAAASLWSDEDSDDCWEQLGILAVRVTGQFAKPRIHVEMSATEEAGGGGEPPR